MRESVEAKARRYLGGLCDSIGETAQSDERPYRFDYAEGPSAGNEPVEACGGTSDGEREHKSRVARFEGVHDHHEGKGAYPEGGQHAP